MDTELDWIRMLCVPAYVLLDRFAARRDRQIWDVTSPSARAAMSLLFLQIVFFSYMYIIYIYNYIIFFPFGKIRIDRRDQRSRRNESNASRLVPL